MIKRALVILDMQLEASVKTDCKQAAVVERETKRTFPDQMHSHTTFNTPSTNRREELRLRRSERLIHRQSINYPSLAKAV
jgi:hypothetical protein